VLEFAATPASEREEGESLGMRPAARRQSTATSVGTRVAVH
jgi:hypothetical protein